MGRVGKPRWEPADLSGSWCPLQQALLQGNPLRSSGLQSIKEKRGGAGGAAASLRQKDTVLYLRAWFTSWTAESGLTSWARITLGKEQRRVKYFSVMQPLGQAGERAVLYPTVVGGGHRPCGQYKKLAYRFPLLSFGPLRSFWSKLTSSSLLEGRRKRSSVEHIWMCSGKGT